MRLRDPYSAARRRSLLGILGVVLVFFIGMGWLILGMTSRSFLEAEDDEFTSDRIKAPVTIVRDVYGIPTIEGSNEEDVMFALGYAHAQDRLWQMEVKRRMATGHLSEVLGRRFLPFDAYMRAFDLKGTAAKILEKTPKETRVVIEAYAQGVNAFIQAHEGRIPFEFDALGFEPALWTPEASILCMRMVAFEQNNAIWSDLFYERLAERVDTALFIDIQPWYPSYGATIIPGGQREEPLYGRIVAGAPAFDPADTNAVDSTGVVADSSERAASSQTDDQALYQNAEQLYQVDRRMRDELLIGGSPIGSNSWVISGDRTLNGKAILACDPHNRQTIPTPWYQAVLITDGRHVAGVTLPGVPFIMIGRNDDIAWGITSMMADESDLYLEKLHPDGSDRVLHDGRWEKLELREEKFQANDMADTSGTVLIIRSSRHGPLLSDLSEFFTSYLESNELLDSGRAGSLGRLMPDSLALAMRWLGRDVSHEITALHKMNRAKNLSQFRDGLKYAGIPGWNVTYADRKGDIAMIPVFRAPKRPSTILNRVNPGWESRYNWRGNYSATSLKSLVNPTSGYISVANNRLSNSLPFSIGDQWDDPARAERINDYLDEGDRLEVIDCVQMHSDVTSPYMVHLIGYLLRSFPDSAEQGAKVREGLALLSHWNGEMSTESPQGMIAAAWVDRLYRETWEDEMGPELFDQFMQIGTLPRLAMRHQLMIDSKWFNRSETPKREIRDDILRKTFGETIERLYEQFETWDFEEWQWGFLHRLTFRPGISVVQNLPGVLAVGPYDVGGSATTLNLTSWSYGGGFEVTVGATMRQIVDFSDSTTLIRSVVSTGASGQPMNGRYADQTIFWLYNGYINLTGKAAPESERLSTITILPGS